MPSRSTVMGTRPLGATLAQDGSCAWRVWAPKATQVDVLLMAPRAETIPLTPTKGGYFSGTALEVPAGSCYRYQLDGVPYADPASRAQPEGVHGPSQVLSADMTWTDSAWTGRPLAEYVIYELHIGTFTPEGTCDAVIPHVPLLKDLGITAIELMPVAQCPGTRNWGYDGVFLYAVQHNYGGPAGLQRLVDACHAQGMVVILDVVYNHLGPEGNILHLFGPYFTDRYQTPWGEAINYDGVQSRPVRDFVIQNALYWVRDMHIDALRLDAIHGIFDTGATHILAEIKTAVTAYSQRAGRSVHLIAESDLNASRVIRDQVDGGYGLDAQWSDDGHHALHAWLTGERSGYYADFGSLEQLADAWRRGYVYTGQYSAYRKRQHGDDPSGLPAERFVVCTQNHDQVGNRAQGDRLQSSISFEAQKFAAVYTILSPYIPLIFMGEEYAESAPFCYFVDHSSPELIEAVRAGRRAEFAAFGWQEDLPDPQDAFTFQQSRLHHELRTQGHHRALQSVYRELLRLRRTLPALAELNREAMDVSVSLDPPLLGLRRWTDRQETVLFCHAESQRRTVTVRLPTGVWTRAFDSEAVRWSGGGSDVPETITSDGDVPLTLEAYACVLFVRQEHYA